MSSESAGLAQQEASASYPTSNTMPHAETEAVDQNEDISRSAGPGPSVSEQRLPASHPIFEIIVNTPGSIVKIGQNDEDIADEYTFFIDKSLPPGQFKNVNDYTEGRIRGASQMYLPLRFIGEQKEARRYWHITEEEEKARSPQINAEIGGCGSEKEDVANVHVSSTKGKDLDRAGLTASCSEQAVSAAKPPFNMTREARYAKYLNSNELRAMRVCEYEHDDENQLRIYIVQLVTKVIRAPGEESDILAFGPEINIEVTAERRGRVALHVQEDYGQFVSGKGRTADEGPRPRSKTGGSQPKTRSNAGGAATSTGLTAAGTVANAQKKGTSISPASSGMNHCIPDFTLCFRVRVPRPLNAGTCLAYRMALTGEVKPLLKYASEKQKAYRQALSQLRKAYSLDGCTHQILFTGKALFV